MIMNDEPIDVISNACLPLINENEC